MKASSEEAFRELYNACYGDVYRFVYQSVRNKPDVEDLVQDIFLQAYRSFDQFRGECGYKTWLFAIAHNRVNSMWRKFFRRKKIYEQYEQDMLTESMPTTETDWERRLLLQQLSETMEQLPDHYREVVVLRYIHDFSVADTAVILSTNEARVRVLSHRAILKLRELWEQGGEVACKTDSHCLKA